MIALRTIKLWLTTASLLLLVMFAGAQHSALDSVKILNERADELLGTRPDSSFALAGSALRIAREDGLRSAEAVSLKYLGLAMLARQQPDSALTYFFEGLNLFASLEGKEKGYINMLNNIAGAYVDLNAYDLALKYAHQAAVKSVESSLFKEAAISHNQLGEILFATGVYAEALKNYYAALQHSQKANYNRGKSNSLANLGKTYTQIGNKELAEKFLMQAYDSYMKEDGEEGTGRVLTNLANLHLVNEEYDRAIKEYHQALTIKQKNKDESGIAVALNNIGYAFMMQGLLDSALPYFERSLEIKIKLNDVKGIASTTNNIGSLWLRKGRLDQAEKHLQAGLKLAQSVNAREYVLESLELLAELHEAKGNKLNSLEFHKQYSEIHNQIYGTQNSNKIAVLQAQYEIEARERTLLESENTNKGLLLSREKYRRRFLFAGLIAALAIILVITYRFTVVQKLVNLLRIREHQKEQLLKELNHRVKNNLQIVGSILRIQSRRLKDPESLKAIVEGQKRIEAMALVHKQLYIADDSTEIELAPTIERLVENSALFHGKEEAGIHLTMDLNGMRTDAGKSMLIGLIVNELVSNAFKHSSTDDPQISISLHKIAQNGIELIIRDDGDGLPQGFDIDKQSSFGLKIVKSFVEKLGGTLHHNDAPGAEFRINIPDIRTSKA